MSVTPHMQKLMLFIQRYTDNAGGVAPTFEEMRRALQLASRSGIARLLEGLEAREFIQRIPHRARAITILKRLPDQQGPTAAYRRALEDIARGRTDPEAHAREVLERFG